MTRRIMHTRKHSKISVWAAGLTLLLITLAGGAQAQTWVSTVDDSFARADSATVGNGWTDSTGKFSIATNRLAVAANASFSTSWLLRPTSETSGHADQRVVIDSYSGNSLQTFLDAALRWGAGPNYYLCQVNLQAGQMAFYKVSGGSPSLISSPVTFSGVTGHALELNCSITGSSLTATLTDVTAATTIATIAPVTDLAYTSGQMGVIGDAATAGSFTRVRTFVAASSTLAASPGTVNTNQSGVSIALTGTGTSWTNGSPGSPVFTLSGSAQGATPAAITAQTVTSATTATVTLTTGSAVQSLTLADPSGGAATTVTVVTPTALTIPALVATPSSSAVALSLAGAAAGGTQPYTFRWYRSAVSGFTPGAGTLVATTTVPTDSDTPPDGSVYYYKVILADNAAATAAPTFEVPVALLAPAIKIGFIGDSITMRTDLSGGLTPADTMIAYLAKWRGPGRSVTLNNQGLNGSDTGVYVTGGALTGTYTGIRNAFVSAGCTHVCIMLGTNDGRLGNSTALYLSNMTLMINDLVANGLKVVVNYASSLVPGAQSGLYTEAILANIQSYRAALDGSSLFNGTTVFKGDVGNFGYFANHPSELADGVHPSTTGVQSMGLLWADAFTRAVLYPAAAGTATIKRRIQ